MKFRRILVGTLLVFAIGAVPWHSAMAAERLSLFVTREELDIWRGRSKNGPYKSWGDAQLNSPGDWDRIKANADDFLANPKSGHWKGTSTEKCYSSQDDGPGGMGNFKIAYQIKDAGFAYLITDDTRYRDAVKNELLSLANEPGLNWNNDARYGCKVSGNNVLELNSWILKHLIAYSFIRHTVSSAERQALDRWFRNYALRFEKYDTEYRNSKFVDRQNGDYKPTSNSCPSSGGTFNIPQELYFGSSPYLRCGFHHPWDNTHDLTALTYGLIGIMVDDGYLMNQARTFFQEFIRYQMWPNGAVGDSFRWSDGVPSKGMSYPTGQVYYMALLAEAFARAGDSSLYDYVTSIGHLSTEGGPKSLRLGIELHQDRMDQKAVQYGTSDSKLATDSRYILDTVMRSDVSSFETADEALSAIIANKYYSDQRMKDRYLRRTPGSPPYPSSWTTSCGGGKDWGSQGPLCFMPGMMFMFGQMENKVWPYSLSGDDSTAPTPPKGLRIQ